MTNSTHALDGTLSAWADAIRDHHPEVVAALFTEDALFQGFDRTHTVGRPGVAAYYAKQPVGLDPQYRVQLVTPIGDDALVAFVDVDFVRPGGEVIPTHLTLVASRVGADWLIRHYHVSKIDA